MKIHDIVLFRTKHGVMFGRVYEIRITETRTGTKTQLLVATFGAPPNEKQPPSKEQVGDRMLVPLESCLEYGIGSRGGTYHTEHILDFLAAHEALSSVEAADFEEVPF